MNTVTLPRAFASALVLSAVAAVAQVNAPGRFQIGLAGSVGGHATHFENSFHVGALQFGSKNDDGAATFSLPLDVQVGVSRRLSLGVCIEPGSYVDSAGTHPNQFLIISFSPRYYIVNGDRFALFGNLDLGAGVLRISEVHQGTNQYTDTYAGGHFRLGVQAQYYFGGKARTQSLVNLSSGIEQATLSRTTESAIVTSVDLGARFVSPDSETRAVLRGTGSTNLQTTSRNPSLVNAFYVDHKRTASGLAIRVGRQTAISGGLLGLFDGVSLAYPVGQGFKLDVMGGKPANNLVSTPGQRLFAAVLEADGLFDRFGGNIYLIDQTVEGNTNRRAVGAEVRYSDEKVSIYSLVDYDTVFKGLNAVSLQGSFLAPAQTSITLLVDGRKAPTLQLTNALISSGQPSIDALLLTMPLDQAIALARATSATAKQALLSVSRPMSERWQLGMDLRYSEIGALPAVGIFEATPATGAQYGLSALLTGSNLYSTRDINTFSVSYLTTPMFKGAQLSYSNLTGLRGEVFTLEPSLRFYTQNSTDGVKTQRITPGLRLSYKYSSRTSLLGETIVERSKTDGPLNHDSSTSVFFYVGYRYELF